MVVTTAAANCPPLSLQTTQNDALPPFKNKEESNSSDPYTDEQMEEEDKPYEIEIFDH